MTCLGQAGVAALLLMATALLPEQALACACPSSKADGTEYRSFAELRAAMEDDPEGAYALRGECWGIGTTDRYGYRAALDISFSGEFYTLGWAVHLVRSAHFFAVVESNGRVHWAFSPIYVDGEISCEMPTS